MSRSSWSVGDVIRLPANSGGYRVWQVVGIFHGGDNQEDVIEIVTLDRIANTQGATRVPVELLNAAIGAFVI